MNDYQALGTEMGKLVAEKNQAYGNSFAKTADFFKLLYPDGIRPDQYGDALLLARVFDKMMRIATNPDAFGESPFRDMAGYSLLGVGLHEAKPVQAHDEHDVQPGDTAVGAVPYVWGSPIPTQCTCPVGMWYTGCRVHTVPNGLPVTMMGTIRDAQGLDLCRCPQFGCPVHTYAHSLAYDDGDPAQCSCIRIGEMSDKAIGGCPYHGNPE